jgi:hypothetical protein
MISIKRWLLPPRVVLVVLGVLLLAACIGKAYALRTRPIVLAPKIWNTRWFQTGLVEGELVLGLWLVAGLYPRRSWLLALACFFGFFQFSFYLFLAGEKTCPCFGNLRTHPGQTALIDLAATLALLACKPFPAGSNLTILSHPHRLRAFLIVFGLAGIPAVVLLGGRPDPSFLPDLRKDRALRERMAFKVDHPTNGELLALLQKNTGAVITADAALATEQTSFGNARFQSISAASLMEQMLGKQSTRTYWLKTDEGYKLTRAPIYLRWLPWLLATTLLGMIAAALMWLQRKMREWPQNISVSDTTSGQLQAARVPRTGLIS